MMDLDEPLFSMMKLSNASKMPAATLRSMFQRGQLTLGMGDRDAPENGMARLFSLRTVYRVAIIGVLSKFGMPPSDSVSVAIAFGDLGGDGIDQNTGKTLRELGRLYSEGLTILSVNETLQRHVWNLKGQNWSDCPVTGEGVLHIDMNDVVGRVHHVLGIKEA